MCSMTGYQISANHMINYQGTKGGLAVLAISKNIPVYSICLVMKIILNFGKREKTGQCQTSSPKSFSPKCAAEG
jgi:hypothetical protein